MTGVLVVEDSVVGDSEAGGVSVTASGGFTVSVPVPETSVGVVFLVGAAVVTMA